MTTRPLQLLLTVFVLASPAAAHAQVWSPSTGVSVCGPDCVASNYLVCPDGEGGAYVAWTESRDYPVTDDDAYVQRITALGQVAPGWPLGGLSLCGLPKMQAPSAIAPDGEGGVFVVWYDDRAVGPTFGTGRDVYIQRVRGDGTLASGWPANGAPATTAPFDQFPEAIVPDGVGGAYVAWIDGRDYGAQNYDVYVQHLTETGAVVAGWPPDGLPACTAVGSQDFIRAVSDGVEGVVIVWGDCRSCNEPTTSIGVYGIRLLPDGSIATGWAADGSLLAPDRAFPLTAPDDGGGFHLVSSTLGDFYFGESWVQRFVFAGVPATGWPPQGVPVCQAPGDRYPIAVAGDGAGGVLFTWIDYRGPGPAVIFASRILPDGSLATGWIRDGVPVSPILGGQSTRPDIVADDSGGAYLCWEWHDYSSGDVQAMVQHLTAQGAAAPGWPAGGVLASTSLAQFHPRAVSDGVGGAIVVWEEAEPRPRSGLFAQRFAADGPTSVALALVRASATSEEVRLDWQGPSAGTLVAHVERRTAATAWETVGDAVRDGPDHLRYEDRTVSPGGRYAYRLGYVDGGTEQFTAESWVDVPLSARFELRGLVPNPTRGDPVVGFSLGGGEAASLEVFDVRGRRVFEQQMGSLGAGTHLVPLGGRGELAAGVYSLRLRQGDRVAVRRGVVVR